MEQKLPISQRYAFLAAIVLILLMIFQSSSYNEEGFQLYANQVILFSLNYLLWAAMARFVFQWTYGLEFSNGQLKSSLLRLTALALTVSLVQLLLSNALYYLAMFVFFDFSLNQMFESFSQIAIRAYASRIVDFLVIVALLRGLANYRKLNEQKLAMAELQSLLTQTRLEALKMQLNPHFLFNSLHAIHAMIGYDNEKARNILIKISGLLRKILELGEKQLIPLHEELDYLKDYLDIEQERFHDRLTVKYEIEDALLPVYVPSLLLQPLAENAIKHGVSTLEEAGEITIKAYQQGKNASISMVNTVASDSPQAKHSTGIGLSNLKKRLEQLYEEDFEFTQSQSATQFIVNITLPIEAHEH